jgi:hypothetical protein
MRLRPADGDEKLQFRAAQPSRDCEGAARYSANFVRFFNSVTYL